VIQRTVNGARGAQRVAIVSAISILVLTSAACSGSKAPTVPDSAASETATPDSTGSGRASASETTIGGALSKQLGAMPLSASRSEGETVDSFTMNWFDVSRISKANGLDRPGVLADRAPWGAQLNNTGGFIPRLMATVPAEAFDSTVKEIGIHPLAITSSLEIERQPMSVMLLSGEFGATDLTSAMGEPKEGIWSVGPVEDFEIDPLGASSVRRVGQGLRFTESEAGVLMSNSTDVARDSAKLAKGSGTSLLDDELIRMVALELDRANVYAARAQFGITSGPERGVFDDGSSVKADVEDPLQLLPFRAMAAGASSKTNTTLVFVNVSEEAAGKNEPLLKRVLTEGFSEKSRQPLSTYFSVESVERTGIVIVATLRPVAGREMWAFNAISGGDIPFRSGAVSRDLKPNG
jgi:hypothetical protein